jgi:hypothetical protein
MRVAMLNNLSRAKNLRLIFNMIIVLVLFLLVAFAMGIPGSGSNQDADAEAPAHAFDFWIGDWNIEQQILQQDGSWLELPAHTSVSATLDGLALIEHWNGQVQFYWEGMTESQSIKGLSVRAYDPKTAKWYIHWMDTRSPRFGDPYAGNFIDGRGEFFREWETPAGKRTGRITFSDITPDSLNWTLAISSDEGKTWQTIWKMKMRREE